MLGVATVPSGVLKRSVEGESATMTAGYRDAPVALPGAPTSLTGTVVSAMQRIRQLDILQYGDDGFKSQGRRG